VNLLLIRKRWSHASENQPRLPRFQSGSGEAGDCVHTTSTILWSGVNKSREKRNNMDNPVFRTAPAVVSDRSTCHTGAIAESEKCSSPERRRLLKAETDKSLDAVVCGKPLKNSRPHFPVENVSPMGLYIHVPFCTSRCPYCAFVTNPYDEVGVARYVDSLIREIELWREWGFGRLRLADFSFDTIYFGGGTPSLLRPEQLSRILQALRSSFRITEPAETTLEINPGTAGVEDLLAFRRSRVNRASLGIQSLDDRELRLMGRSHTAGDALRAFETLRVAGFEDISVDLIAGYPGQSPSSLGATLQRVIEFRPEHISIYLLELKEHTRLAEQVQRGQAPSVDDDLAADMYENFCQTVTFAGYEHYEISNFAIPGHCSRHNLKYWSDALYVGLGVGAHGMTGRTRYANAEHLARYEQMLQRGEFPFASVEELTPETRFKDALIMGLRLVEGVDLAVLGSRYGLDATAFVRQTVGDLVVEGLVALEQNRVMLTSRGRLLSNVVFSRWV